MRILRGANLIVALLLEIALLVALVAAALQLDLPVALRVQLAILLPVAVVAVWGILFSPRAAHRLAPAPRTMLEAALFAVGAGFLVATGLVVPGIVFAAVAAVHLVLRVQLRQL